MLHTALMLSALTSTNPTSEGGVVGRPVHAAQSEASSEKRASSVHAPRDHADARAVPTYSKPHRSSTRADARLRGSMVAATRWTPTAPNRYISTASAASTA